MRVTRLYILAFFLVITCKVHAQAVKALTLNTKVPDFEIGNIWNSKVPAGKISRYKGKLVIFDFWHTTCSACISGFPKMMALQKEYGDKIKIFLVTKNSDEEINKLFNRLDVKLPNLTVISNDTLLQRLFPYRALPNHVWIDQDGTFVSSTFDYNTNETNITKLLNKQAVLVSNVSFGSKPLVINMY